MTPVENVDQFISRFRSVLKIRCLRQEERRWIELLFEKFSSSSEPPRSWDESSIVGLLTTTFIDELQGDLVAAGPLLFRAMIRLGSFPYHNRSVSTLAVDVVSVAVILSLRYHQTKISSITRTSLGGFGSDEKGMRWLRRILFQCMMIRDESTSDCDLRGIQCLDRSESDDEDLLGAHRFVTTTNRWRDWEREPKIMRLGPPIIPALALPSSQSRDLAGSIARAEFDPLVKILLTGHLYLSGCDLESPARKEQLEACATSILNAFSQANEVPYITWDMYDKILSSQLPNIYNGFAGLFAPLIFRNGACIEQIASSTRTETASFLRQAYSMQNTSISSGSILDPFVLAQARMFLPLELCSQEPSIVYMVESDAFRLDVLRNQLGLIHQHLVILVNGVALDATSAGENKPVCFGAFIPQSVADVDSEEQFEEMPAILFQLRPIHSVSYNSINSYSSRIEGNAVEIAFHKPGHMDEHLIFDEEAQTVSYCAREGNEEYIRSIHIKGAKMDLISLGPFPDTDTEEDEVTS